MLIAPTDNSMYGQLVLLLHEGNNYIHNADTIIEHTEN